MPCTNFRTVSNSADQDEIGVMEGEWAGACRGRRKRQRLHAADRQIKQRTDVRSQEIASSRRRRGGWRRRALEKHAHKPRNMKPQIRRKSTRGVGSWLYPCTHHGCQVKFRP